jgi:S1-C subfamily serine protease
LTSDPGRTKQHFAAQSAQAERRVSLGIVPDYAVSADGVRITGVRAETPAALAGLRPGDVITGLNETPVHNLRDYTRVLKEFAPGDAIELAFRRDGIKHQASVRLTGR